jgi:hypothetical protein
MRASFAPFRSAACLVRKRSGGGEGVLEDTTSLHVGLPRVSGIALALGSSTNVRNAIAVPKFMVGNSSFHFVQCCRIGYQH